MSRSEDAGASATGPHPESRSTPRPEHAPRPADINTAVTVAAGGKASATPIPPASASPPTPADCTALEPADPRTRTNDWGPLPAAPADWQAGQQVGPFLLKRPLGQGGMGMVWLAEQQEPLVRDVALKVMLQTEQHGLVEAYFEIERQALARLSHRAIAQIYDAGKLPNGALFFAMEYVPGAPLHSYLQSSQANLRQLASLMVDVCRGIQHAHQRGLIHRDIKPGNILVIDVDGTPQAKVIDFGIAVARSADGSSRIRDVAGTESYMSPEQRQPGPAGIDARADVYSLGAVLAECLYLMLGRTAERPGAASTRWREEIGQSLKSSLRLKTSAGAASATRTDPAADADPPAQALSRLPAELRAIALKALAPEPDARYDTAAAMADDLRRWMQSQPVLAMAGGKLYAMRCFVQRYALACAAAALVLLALIAGVAGTLHGLAQAQRNLELANQNLAFARKGVDILGSVFAQLDPQQRYASVGELSQALRQNLATAVQELDGADIGDPLAVAQMQMTVARSLRGLGDFAGATRLLERALATRQTLLGHDDPETLQSLHQLAHTHREAGQMDVALRLAEQTLTLRRSRLGADHPDTISSMSTLASGYWSEGQFDRAIALEEQVLALQTARLGPDHPDTDRSRVNLAISYRSVGKLELALALYEQTLASRRTRLGPDHPRTLLVMNNLALARQSTGELGLAQSLLEEMVERSRARLGPEHPDTLLGMNNLASTYRLAGQLDLALPLAERSLALRTAHLGAEHPHTLFSVYNLALTLADADRGAEAATHFEAYLAARRTQLAENRAELASELARTGAHLIDARQFAAAERHLRDSLALRQRDAAGTWPTFNTQSLLGAALLGQGRLVEAEPLLREGYAGLQALAATPGDDPRLRAFRALRIPEALDRLIVLAEQTRRSADVERYRAERARYTGDPWIQHFEVAHQNGPFH